MDKKEASKRLDAIEKEAKELRAIIEQPEETKKKRVVDSVHDIPNRKWYINTFGNIVESAIDINGISTKERAEAVLALIQLLEIHADIGQPEHIPWPLKITSNSTKSAIQFWFESREIKDEFERKHKDLIETVERGL